MELFNSRTMKKYLLLFIFDLLFSIYNITNAQWTQLNSGTGNSLEELFFPASDTGYVVGEHGTVLKTVNGNSWTSQFIGSNLNLKDVFFLPYNVQ